MDSGTTMIASLDSLVVQLVQGDEHQGFDSFPDAGGDFIRRYCSLPFLVCPLLHRTHAQLIGLY